MAKKIKKLDMRGILDLNGYEIANIVTEDEFIEEECGGVMEEYALISDRKANNLIRRDKEVERWVVERNGKYFQVDVIARIFMRD